MPIRAPQQTEPTAGLEPIHAPNVRPAGPSGQREVAEGLDKFAQGTEEWQKAFDAADTASELQASAELEAYATSLYDDDQNGLLNKHGYDGFRLTDQTLGKLEAKRQELMKGLPSNEARAKFDLKTRSLVEARRRQGEGHAAIQREVVRKVALENRLNASLNGIAHSADNPELRERMIAAGVDGINETYAAIPEEAEKRRADWLSKSHGGVIMGLIQVNPLLAREYLNDHAQLLGADYIQYKHMVDQASLDGEAERLAQVIEAATTDALGRPNATENEDRLDVIKDTALRDETEKRLLARQKRRKAEWDEKVDRVKEVGLMGLNSHPEGIGPIPSAVRAWLHMHAPKTESELIDLRQRRISRLRAGAAEQRRMQNEWNQSALLAYLADPDRNARVNYNVELRYSMYGADKDGLNRIREEQNRDRESIASGLAMQEDEFIRLAVSQSGNVLRSQDDIDNFKKAARIVFYDWAGDPKKGNGKGPGPNDSMVLISDLHSKILKNKKYWKLEWQTEVPKWKDIVEGATNKVKGLPAPMSAAPEPNIPKVDANTRRRQLRAEGKTANEIAEMMNAEGY